MNERMNECCTEEGRLITKLTVFRWALSVVAVVFVV